MRDNNELLYEGLCKVFEVIIHFELYHIKGMIRMRDKAITMILDLLNDAFEHGKFPNSFYEVKNMVTNLGLNYVKIPVCPKQCMLY